MNARCKFCNICKDDFCPVQQVPIVDADIDCLGDIWVDFEIWLGNVQVMGYMNSRDAHELDALQFFGADGLECYNDFSKTNYVGETAHTTEEVFYLLKWCLIQDWLEKTDVASTIAEHALDEVVVEYGAFPSNDDGMDAKLELLINCSKIQQGEYQKFNTDLEVYVKE